MKDDEQGPSEDEDSGEHEEIPEAKGGHTLEDAPILGTIDMDRQLPPDVKWLCIGKMPDGSVALFLPDSWEPDELSGFIHRVAQPDFIIQNINQNRK